MDNRALGGIQGSGRKPISEWLEEQRARAAFRVEQPAREKSRIGAYIGFAALGAVMIAGVAAAGHYIGSRDTASSAMPGPEWADVVSPNPRVLMKASLSTSPGLGDVYVETRPQRQSVRTRGKGNFLVDQSLVNVAAKGDRSLDLVPSPPRWKLEYSWKLGSDRKRALLAARRFRIAQHKCLARAIYFEARSEPELGQVAVAKVIMNRVKSSRFPGNICDVVYQGSHRRNSCQFSFACDGIADKPLNMVAWRKSREIATRVMNGADKETVITAATFYHADYVRPKWSSAMKRVIKIGRHIFYRGS